MPIMYISCVSDSLFFADAALKSVFFVFYGILRLQKCMVTWR